MPRLAVEGWYLVDKIIKAVRYAGLAHEGQSRKWGHAHIPYLSHPIRVAAMVMLNKEMDFNTHEDSEDMVVAAYLHDVVEDSSFTISDIRDAFGPSVADLVDWLTNSSKGMNAPRADRKKIDREKLKRAPWKAKIIKLCDRIDNLIEAIEDQQTPRDFLKKYQQESILMLDECLLGVDDDLESELRKLATDRVEKTDLDESIERARQLFDTSDSREVQIVVNDLIGWAKNNAKNCESLIEENESLRREKNEEDN